MVPGARSKFGAPMFELQVFRKIEESACATLLGLFGTPSSHSASPPVICRPHIDSGPGELRKYL